MAKNKNILLSLFLLVSCIGLSGQNTGSGLREKVSAIYAREIGTRELTGHNDGRKVELYLAATGLKKGNPWCAAFVAWTFSKANVKASFSAWAPAWFPVDKTIYVAGKGLTPARADVFGIYYQAKGRIGHVGFIDDWQPNTSHVITVEGNTNNAGSREGDGVYRKRRLKSQIYKVSRWIN